MPTSISQTLGAASSNFFVDEGFLVFYDDQVPRMLEVGNVEKRPIAPTDALKYRHDFLGLMNLLKVPYPCHTVAAKINGIKGNRLPDHQIDTILIPSAEGVRTMYNTWKSTQTVRK